MSQLTLDLENLSIDDDKKDFISSSSASSSSSSSSLESTTSVEIELNLLLNEQEQLHQYMNRCYEHDYKLGLWIDLAKVHVKAQRMVQIQVKIAELLKNSMDVEDSLIRESFVHHRKMMETVKRMFNTELHGETFEVCCLPKVEMNDLPGWIQFRSRFSKFRSSPQMTPTDKHLHLLATLSHCIKYEFSELPQLSFYESLDFVQSKLESPNFWITQIESTFKFFIPNMKTSFELDILKRLSDLVTSLLVLSPMETVSKRTLTLVFRTLPQNDLISYIDQYSESFTLENTHKFILNRVKGLDSAKKVVGELSYEEKGQDIWKRPLKVTYNKRVVKNLISVKLFLNAPNSKLWLLLGKKKDKKYEKKEHV